MPCNIFKQTAAIIERTHPVCAAIEQSVYVQNFKTAMILGSSRERQSLRLHWLD
ncbi:MAG: hypothetical protein ACLUKN_02570 [Bacilli bacterium]